MTDKCCPRADVVSTHWEGCHTSHPECAAFKAGREQGMREAAAIVHSREMAREIALHVRPYEPISEENVALLMEDCHDACVAIHRAILAAIGEGK
jgi:hypothetical protein